MQTQAELTAGDRVRNAAGDTGTITHILDGRPRKAAVRLDGGAFAELRLSELEPVDSDTANVPALQNTSDF